MGGELEKQPNPPRTLARHAAEMGFKALALTDHGALFGAIEFYKSCKKAGIKPILGCELYVAPGGRHDRAAAGQVAEDFHLVVLASSLDGYRNLVELVTAAHLDSTGSVPRVDRDLLAKHAGGLLATSACPRGEVGVRFLRGETELARKAIGAYAEIFGRANFFLELEDHGLEDERRLNRFLVEESGRMGLGIVAANDTHYLRKQDAEAHDVLLCLQQGAMQADERRRRFGSEEYYLKSAEEMAAVFGGLPGALRASVEIAERCAVELELEQNKFPAFPVEPGVDREGMLRGLCAEGLRRRYPAAFAPGADAAEREKLERQLDYELGVISRTGFTSYFLIVWDFIRFAKENGIPVGPGRGSAAGSLVAYALGITDIDPVRYGLIFERFLNPERVSPPDIDVDFCYNRRGEVHEYVRRKYGDAAVAQIITFGTMGAKAAVRDVARVLGLPYAAGDRISKMIPQAPDMTLHKAKEQSPEFKAAVEGEEETRRVVELAGAIEGLNRQAGVHAAGVVISDGPLARHVPLARGAEGEVITQYDMSAVSDVGLLKMDFLGLRTLTVIRDALAMIRRVHGVEVRPEEIPLDDPKAIDILNRGRNTGLFQLESAGMRELCRSFNLRGIDDLIALIALYRPGPMDLIPDFTARRKGEVQIRYAHPLLEQCCADTYGVMIYQEQVMKAAAVLAGYTLGGSDNLRRAMGKKDRDKMAKERETFVEGCARQHGIGRAKAEEVFDLLEKFAGYGFNKSHSAAYGVVAFHTAWLKAHYPVEFMAALMCNDIGNTEKLAEFCAECAALGIQVLPPSVNRGGARFEVEDGAIRYGMAAIKGVGEAAVAHLVAERDKGGPFRDLADFCGRCDPRVAPKKMVENLVKAGAADEWDPNRARLFAQIEEAFAASAGMHRDSQSGQASLFGEIGGVAAASKRGGAGKETPDWSHRERLAFEKELMGVYFSGHPLDEHRAGLGRFVCAPCASLGGVAERTVVRIAGRVASFEQRYSKDKRPFGRGVFEDASGSVALFVPGDQVEKLGKVLSPGFVGLVAGLVERDRSGEGSSLKVIEAVPLEEAVWRYANGLDLAFPEGRDVDLDRLKEVLLRDSGRCGVRLLVPVGNGMEAVIEADRHYAVRASATLQEQVEAVVGAGAVVWTVEPSPPLPVEPKREFRGKAGWGKRQPGAG